MHPKLRQLIMPQIQILQSTRLYNTNTQQVQTITPKLIIRNIQVFYERGLL